MQTVPVFVFVQCFRYSLFFFAEFDGLLFSSCLIVRLMIRSMMIIDHVWWILKVMQCYEATFIDRLMRQRSQYFISSTAIIIYSCFQYNSNKNPLFVQSLHLKCCIYVLTPTWWYLSFHIVIIVFSGDSK